MSVSKAAIPLVDSRSSVDVNRSHNVSHYQQNRWRKAIFSSHVFAKNMLEQSYMTIAKRYGQVAANQRLVQFTDSFERKDLKLSMDDDVLREWCQKKADMCERWATGTLFTTMQAVVKMVEMLEEYGLEFPWDEDSGAPIEPAIKRVSDSAWWRRQIRVLQSRELEEYARNSRIVHHKKNIYVSDHAVETRRQQRKRNKAILKSTVAVNCEGDEFSLDELSDRSVSNPVIRRSELMVRISGFEEYANQRGFVGEFLTVTAPSKYHAIKSDGTPNEKWNKSTVRQANTHLVNVGARIRAKLARLGIEYFGFRVAEPHHDGCPHWHYLIHCSHSDAYIIRGIFAHYALEEDGTERGAKKHRFTAKRIDPARGTAAGYIAKYIAKNIDGHGLNEDLYGHESKSSAARIEAWAALHGIRQFQQIGGPSVTVWRELRRIEGHEKGQLEQCREAADTANWSAYCDLMGSGKNQAIKLARWHEVDVDTGEYNPVNKYGEWTSGQIFGLVCGDDTVLTRLYRWTIERAASVKKEIKSGIKATENLIFGVPGAWVLESDRVASDSSASVNYAYEEYEREKEIPEVEAYKIPVFKEAYNYKPWGLSLGV